MFSFFNKEREDGIFGAMGALEENKLKVDILAMEMGFEKERISKLPKKKRLAAIKESAKDFSIKLEALLKTLE